MADKAAPYGIEQICNGQTEIAMVQAWIILGINTLTITK
jgi:hypothetical protein